MLRGISEIFKHSDDQADKVANAYDGGAELWLQLLNGYYPSNLFKIIKRIKLYKNHLMALDKIIVAATSAVTTTSDTTTMTCNDWCDNFDRALLDMPSNDDEEYSLSDFIYILEKLKEHHRQELNKKEEELKNDWWGNNLDKYGLIDEFYNYKDEF